MPYATLDAKSYQNKISDLNSLKNNKLPYIVVYI